MKLNISVPQGRSLSDKELTVYVDFGAPKVVRKPCKFCGEKPAGCQEVIVVSIVSDNEDVDPTTPFGSKVVEKMRKRFNHLVPVCKAEGCRKQLHRSVRSSISDHERFLADLPATYAGVRGHSLNLTERGWSGRVDRKNHGDTDTDDE